MIGSRPPILVIGCGPWGALIVRDLVALGAAVTVVARTAESIGRARANGAHTIVPTIDAAPEAQGVVVAVPTTRHAAAVRAALDRGRPIYCEKPLAASVGEAEEIVARASERIFVMDKWRYHPGIEALAAIVRSRELGAPVGLHSTRVGWTRRTGDVNGVWHLVPHDLAIGLEILGAIPAPRAAVVERIGGAVVGMQAILGQTPWLSIDASERRPAHRREVRLVCEHGVASLADSYSDHIQVMRFSDAETREPPAPERRAISGEMPLLRELAAFLDHIDGGPPPKSGAADGLTVVRTIAALLALAGEASGDG